MWCSFRSLSLGVISVVVVSFVGIAIELYTSSGSVSIGPALVDAIRMMRMLRLLRAFRIFRGFKKLRRLVLTLIRSLPLVSNLLALLLIAYSVTGVLCVELYGAMCVEDPRGGHRVEVSLASGLLDRYLAPLPLPSRMAPSSAARGRPLTLPPARAGRAWRTPLSTFRRGSTPS